MERLTLVRQDHWQRRLVAWAESCVGRPYVWGETDCVSLAAGAVAVLTGRSLADLEVPSYANRFGALRALVAERQAFGSIREAWVARGLVVVQPGSAYAQSGDLLLWEETEHTTPEITIVVGSHVLVASPAAGAFLEPITAAHYGDAACVVLRVP